MTLQDEIEKARKEILADGYDMSVGEIMSLYKEKEIIINPDFQRLFRWTKTQKTRFIESLLLGIPIPPIFVFQNEDGIWELIDGLQRLSTVFEFAGILRQPEGEFAPPTYLEETEFLPSLAGKCWSSDENDNGIGKTNQLEIKRARMRVEILRKISDPLAKYELFQRLNTGGAKLSEQEVRNCIAVMLNKPFYEWLKQCADNTAFVTTVTQTEPAVEKQMNMELALRFIAFRNIPYKAGLDVHEYLNYALKKIAKDSSFSLETEGDIFKRTFTLLNRVMGDKAFKKWDGKEFKGRFLMPVFEVMAIGVSKNIEQIEKMPQEGQSEFIREKSKKLWEDESFSKYSRSGIGAKRIYSLLSIAEEFFKP
ncbi:MAG: DUF262 domain-containing protein [Desulfobacterales bacterium]|nr:DUF262 domain-containing protein [Desulfobacterales bacterium]